MKVVIDEEKLMDLLEIQWGYEGIREDVQRVLRENSVPYEEEVPNYAMGYQDGVRKVLKEVAEGKHRSEGEWITDNLHNTICNKCGGIRRDNRVAYIAFCNKCGARMKGGENVQE